MLIILDTPNLAAFSLMPIDAPGGECLETMHCLGKIETFQLKDQMHMIWHHDQTDRLEDLLIG